MPQMRGYALAGVVALLLATTGIVAANAAPMAEAGLDQEAPVNATVYLDAGGSWDPDGNLTGYEWRIERPDGTVTTPACPTCPQTSFVPRQVGRYNVTVRVTDEDGASSTDTLYLDVSTSPPTSPVVSPPTGSGSTGGSSGAPGPVLGGDGGGGGGGDSGGASLSVNPSRILRTASGEYVLRTPEGTSEGEFRLRVGGETVQIPEWKMNSLAQDDGRVTYDEVSDQFNRAGASRDDVRHELQNSYRSCGSYVCTAMVSETTGAPTPETPSESAMAELRSRAGEGVGETSDDGDISDEGSGGSIDVDVENSIPYNIGEIDTSANTGDIDFDTGGLRR